MTKFTREFPINCLTETVLEENSWFTDLLLRWKPAGDSVTSHGSYSDGVLARDRVTKGELQHVRVAFRGHYMNFYCGGQSIAGVSFGRDGLQAKIHEKYIYGCDRIRQKYIELTSKGYPELGTGRLVFSSTLQEWISNANNKIGTEKRFVDLIVALNADVVDLEMGLPAYSSIPQERRAPRIDLVALEPHEGQWQVVLWEAKLVGDGRARCRGNDLPRVVVEQLKPYSDWLSDGDRARAVALAYQHNCRMLVDLHAIASRFRSDIGELGPGIRAVAASAATHLSVDTKPRLLMICDKKDKAFREHGHLDKLLAAGWYVKMAESLSEVALFGRI